MISTLDADADALAFPVLVADIGGTNTRFSLLRDAGAEPETFPVVPTADFESLDEAIRRVVLDHTATPPRSAVLALAGPIDGDEIDLTNAPWVVRPRTLIGDLGFGEVLVMNDFEAQAIAVASLPDDERRQIGGGSVHEGASRVVVGPGTGLGVAGLVPARGFWIPVAGEGGHVDLGPRTDRDRRIWPHLQAIEGRVSAEQVLCGRGLVNLYRAVCAVDGVEATFDTPARVTDAAVNKGDAQAMETVELFALYLGRFAGDLALLFMARGGVYIGGGIFPHFIAILKADEMRAAFEDKAPHADLMREIPLFAITQPLAALAGLAAYARDPRVFGLETEGRRWTA